MNDYDKIRTNGILDYIIISLISSKSLPLIILAQNIIILIMANILKRLQLKQNIILFISKEFLLIIVNLIQILTNIININPNFSLIVNTMLLFFIYLYLTELLVKLTFCSKLILSNFLLNIIQNKGKYLSGNFITGNAVELFIIESLFLLNSLQLLFNQTEIKNQNSIYLSILGIIPPLYTILKNFIFLWNEFLNCVYYFFFTKTFKLFIYWTMILIIFFNLYNKYIITSLKIKQIIKRKFFHFLGFFIIVPGIYYLDKNIFKLITIIVSYLFIVIEIIRNFPILKNFNWIKSINTFIKESIDTRDSENFVLTHLFLMTGMVSSVFFEFTKFEYYFLSIIILGIGDAMCSIVGTKYGKTKIYPGNNRTLEGSLGGLICSLIIFMILRGKLIIEIKELIGFFLVFLYEGYTLEIDNLVLPLFCNYLFYNFLNEK